MEMIPLEDDFKDQPKTIEALSGFLQCLHYDLFPTAAAKVAELTGHFRGMTKAVKFLTESFGAGFEEVEAKEGEKTIIAKLPQTLIEKYWLGRILEPDLMNMLVNLWKQYHGEEEVETDELQKAKKDDACFELCKTAREIKAAFNWERGTFTTYCKTAAPKPKGLKTAAKARAKKRLVTRDLK